MRKMWIVAGILTTALVATVAVAEARGPGGPGQGGMMGRSGMVGQGPGLMMGQGGMMGRGGMMGGGGMMSGFCQGGTYDPEAIQANVEAHLTAQKTNLANLEAQLAAATDEQVKENLAIRIERERLMISFHESKLAVVQTLPADAAAGAIALAQHDVDFYTNATATYAFNQRFIAQHLRMAQLRLEALTAQPTAQTNS